MAGLLPPLLVKYTNNTNTVVKELTTLTALGELIVRNSTDNVSLERISKINNLLINKKKNDFDINFKVEFAERVPELISQVKYLGQIEIDKYNKILQNFDVKIENFNQLDLALVSSLSDFMVDYMTTVLSFEKLSMLNITTLTIRDLITNTLLVLGLVLYIWPIYINNCLATAKVSIDAPGYKPHGFFEAAFIAGQMAVQVGLLIAEMIYLMLKIIQYIMMTILALMLMMIYYVSVVQLFMVKQINIMIELMEQEEGKLSVTPLPLMINAGVNIATARLKIIEKTGLALKPQINSGD